MSKNVFNEMTSEKKEEKRNKEGNRLIVNRHRIYQNVCTPHVEEEKKYTRCYI